MDGKCSALFFTGQLESSISRPEKELKGFEKKMIPAGEKVNYEIKLDESSFSYYDEREKCFVTRPGRYAVCAAYAADDVRSLAEIQITKEYRIKA